jgi:hypothetical protein
MGVWDEQNPQNQQQQNQLKQLMALLSAAQQARQQQQPQAQPQPQTTQGMVGQVGQSAMPMPQIPFNTSGAARPVAPPSQNRPQANQLPMPDLQTSYPTDQAVKAGVTKSAIDSVIQLVNSTKQKKQQDESIRAENYFSQIMTAAQDPSDPNNKKILDVLTGDPKVMKTIEKGLDYTFAQDNSTKKPEPPESHGLKAALQKMVGKQAPLPKSQPAAGQPGGILLPGPTAAAKLLAQMQSGQLSAAQQSPQVRQQISGMAPSAETQAKLDTTERIAAGRDFTLAQIAYEKSKDEAAKLDAEYNKQKLANQGRTESATAVARINAQARVDAAKITAQASLSRMLGRAAKLPSPAVQMKYNNMKLAQSTLDVIMSGDTSQATYNRLIGDLKGSGLTGILSEVPGQSGGPMSKSIGAITGKTVDSDAKWKTVQKGLKDSLNTYEGALSTSFPNWNLGKPTSFGDSGGSKATPQSPVSSSEDNVIVVSPDDMSDLDSTGGSDDGSDDQ